MLLLLQDEMQVEVDHQGEHCSRDWGASPSFMRQVEVENGHHDLTNG